MEQQMQQQIEASMHLYDEACEQLELFKKWYLKTGGSEALLLHPTQVAAELNIVSRDESVNLLWAGWRASLGINEGYKQKVPDTHE